MSIYGEILWRNRSILLLKLVLSAICQIKVNAKSEVILRNVMKVLLQTWRNWRRDYKLAKPDEGSYKQGQDNARSMKKLKQKQTHNHHHCNNKKMKIVHTEVMCVYWGMLDCWTKPVCYGRSSKIKRLVGEQVRGDKLSFVGLMHQITTAKQAGYEERKIVLVLLYVLWFLVWPF